jgi:hypothetical protein
MTAVTTSYPSRRAASAALAATPLLWLLAAVALPGLRASADEQLALVAAHQQRWYAYCLLLIAGSMLFVPAVLGLARLARPAARRLTALASGLLVFSSLVATADAVSELYLLQMVRGGADQAQMAALLERWDGAPGVAVVFAPGGLGWIVGAVLMAAALARVAAVPTWAAVALGGSLIVQVAGFMAYSVVTIGVGAAVALVAVVPLARLLQDAGLGVPAQPAPTPIAA